jgi:hypothetical protein
MPYPTQVPTNKHDLIGPLGLLFDDNNLLLQSEFRFISTAALFDAVARVLPPDIKNSDSCYVYSYPDGPQHPGPLSRSLIVVGVADTSLR